MLCVGLPRVEYIHEIGAQHVGGSESLYQEAWSISLLPPTRGLGAEDLHYYVGLDFLIFLKSSIKPWVITIRELNDSLDKLTES